MANDPLYTMDPTDRDWHATLAEEAEALVSALYGGDEERAARKMRQLHHAIHKMTEAGTLAMLYRADGAPPFVEGPGSTHTEGT